MQNQYVTLGILTLFLSVICFRVEARTPIKLIDQYGNPVHGAVITYKTSVETTNTSSALDNSLSDRPSLAIMDQIDRQFSPFVLAVKTGTSVSFPNSDDIRHHVYSFSEVHPFEIRLYKGTPSSPETYAEQGIVELGCNIHDKMRGFIYVTNDEFAPATDKQGMTSLPNSPLSQIKVWHPRLARDRIQHISIVIPELDELGVKTITLTLLDGVDQPEQHTHSFKKKFN